jgi:hypothetical protein
VSASVTGSDDPPIVAVDLGLDGRIVTGANDVDMTRCQALLTFFALP